MSIKDLYKFLASDGMLWEFCSDGTRWRLVKLPIDGGLFAVYGECTFCKYDRLPHSRKLDLICYAKDGQIYPFSDSPLGYALSRALNAEGAFEALKEKFWDEITREAVSIVRAEGIDKKIEIPWEVVANKAVNLFFGGEAQPGSSVESMKTENAFLSIALALPDFTAAAKI